MTKIFKVKSAEKRLSNFITINLIIISVSFLITLISSCELPHQPGPMPKEIIDLNFEPGFNILGVVRLNGNNPESFVFLDEALKTEDYYKYENRYEITNASVIISDNDSLYHFNIYDEIDSTRYINQNFIPKENKTYYLEISATGTYGDLHLTAETIVPTIPSLNKNSIILKNDNISFDLFTTDNAFRYDIVLFFQNEEIRESILINESSTQNIEINFSKQLGEPVYIGIAAYDKNLTQYLNATSSIIPQTYHEDISTVDEGYGCFGAISLNSIKLSD